VPKKAWNWYHRQQKKEGYPDIDNKEDADAMHEEWKNSGKPDSEGHRTEGKNQRNNPRKHSSADDDKSEMVDTAIKVGVTVGAGYLIYRGIRMIPSLFPPLWPTIPANLVIP
jgi:hypothetical protein